MCPGSGVVPMQGHTMGAGETCGSRHPFEGNLHSAGSHHRPVDGRQCDAGYVSGYGGQPELPGVQHGGRHGGRDNGMEKKH